MRRSQTISSISKGWRGSIPFRMDVMSFTRSSMKSGLQLRNMRTITSQNDVGLQPYITMEIYGRLKAAFREYRDLRKGAQAHGAGLSTQSFSILAGLAITLQTVPSRCTRQFNTMDGLDRIQTDTRPAPESIASSRASMWRRTYPLGTLRI